MRRETSADRENQRRIMDAFIQCHPRWEAVRFPDFWSLDWGCTDHTGDIGAFVECKRRHHAYGEFKDGFMISLHKILAGRYYAEATGRLFYLVIGLDDGVYYLQVTDSLTDMCRIGVGGRKDRGSDESEPCLFIPYAAFTPCGIAEYAQ